MCVLFSARACVCAYGCGRAGARGPYVLARVRACARVRIRMFLCVCARVGVHARALEGAESRACGRACAPVYACMIDHRKRSTSYSDSLPSA